MKKYTTKKSIFQAPIAEYNKRITNIFSYDIHIAHSYVMSIYRAIEKEQKIKMLEELFIKDDTEQKPIHYGAIKLIELYLAILCDQSVPRMRWKLSKVPNPRDSVPINIKSFIVAVRHSQSPIIKKEIRDFIYNLPKEAQQFMFWVSTGWNQFGLAREYLKEILTKFDILERIDYPNSWEFEACPNKGLLSTKVELMDSLPAYMIKTDINKERYFYKLDGEVISDFSKRVTEALKHFYKDKDTACILGLESSNKIVVYFATTSKRLIDFMYHKVIKKLPRKYKVCIADFGKLDTYFNDLREGGAKLPLLEKPDIRVCSSTEYYLNILSSSTSSEWLVISNKGIKYDKIDEAGELEYIVDFKREVPYRFAMSSGKEIDLQKCLFEVSVKNANTLIGGKFRVIKYKDEYYLRKYLVRTK